MLVYQEKVQHELANKRIKTYDLRLATYDFGLATGALRLIFLR